jgi:copper transport protein
MVAAVCHGRHQRGAEVHAAQLGLRFSVVATFALVTVAVAGMALTVTIVDGPSDLISTGWGRLLLVKVALVATAASAGAYNHKVLVPALQERPDDPVLIARFRRVVTTEAVVLVAVGAVTAWLVGSAA